MSIDVEHCPGRLSPYYLFLTCLSNFSEGVRLGILRHAKKPTLSTVFTTNFYSYFRIRLHAKNSTEAFKPACYRSIFLGQCSCPNTYDKLFQSSERSGWCHHNHHRNGIRNAGSKKYRLFRRCNCSTFCIHIYNINGNGTDWRFASAN